VWGVCVRCGGGRCVCVCGVCVCGVGVCGGGDVGECVRGGDVGECVRRVCVRFFRFFA